MRFREAFGECRAMQYESWRALSLLLLSIFMSGCGRPDPTSDAGIVSLVAAQEAVQSGDKQHAMMMLTAAIETKPHPWALLERAKLHAEEGNDEQAMADIRTGLEIDSLNTDLHWMEKELQKPSAQRFKTKPPSALK